MFTIAADEVPALNRRVGLRQWCEFLAQKGVLRIENNLKKEAT
jgi:hypothetical protein